MLSTWTQAVTGLIGGAFHTLVDFSQGMFWICIAFWAVIITLSALLKAFGK